MSTLSNRILSVLRRRTTKGLTVGEIYDRVAVGSGITGASYSSVRARVYELAKSGKLNRGETRRDTTSNYKSATFTRAQ